MLIAEAQRDVRRAYAGGFFGQLVFRGGVAGGRHGGHVVLFSGCRRSAMVSTGVLFLYGMMPVPSAVGGWLTGALLVTFAFLLRASARSLETAH